MKDRILWCLFILAALSAAGCKRNTQLNGEVFVVTRGAQNIKMALVEVKAIREEFVREYFARKQAEATGEDEDMVTAEFYLKEMEFLPVIEKATTNGDGKFSMALPAKGKFALFAKAKRLTLDKEERYYWLVWVTVDKADSLDVMLSNDNLLSPDDPSILATTAFKGI
jgi:hypothetical protein